MNTTYFTDERDGQEYRTVEIGGVVWLAENLRYKTPSSSWPANNQEANVLKYGRLYTWDAAVEACPDGWRLPTRQEWDDLITFAGGEDKAGKRLKAKDGWDSINWGKASRTGNGVDRYGFSATPGGDRLTSGYFEHTGEYAHYWSSTQTIRSYISSNREHFEYSAFLYTMHKSKNYFLNSEADKGEAHSVRCVQIQPAAETEDSINQDILYFEPTLTPLRLKFIQQYTENGIFKIAN